MSYPLARADRKGVVSHCGPAREKSGEEFYSALGSGVWGSVDGGGGLGGCLAPFRCSRPWQQRELSVYLTVKACEKRRRERKKKRKRNREKENERGRAEKKKKKKKKTTGKGNCWKS